MRIAELTRAAERLAIPLRTVDDVKAALDKARLHDMEHEVAAFILKHGRLTPEAREYLKAFPS